MDIVPQRVVKARPAGYVRRDVEEHVVAEEHYPVLLIVEAEMPWGVPGRGYDAQLAPAVLYAVAPAHEGEDGQRVLEIAPSGVFVYLRELGLGEAVGAVFVHAVEAVRKAAP